MPWNKYLFEKDRNVSGIVAEKSEKILQDESEKSKLMNWYMVADNIGLNKGILACQRKISHGISGCEEGTRLQV